MAAVLCAAVLLLAAVGQARAQAASRGAGEMAIAALGLLGKPYRYGGDDPASGFDCSGLVRFLARSILGVDLPRRAEEISRVGLAPGREQLQTGDLVFFNTLGRPFSHVGVYLGDGQFVHAPARRGQVRVEQISEPYWRSRFDGARRLGEVATSGSAADSGDSRQADAFAPDRP